MQVGGISGSSSYMNVQDGSVRVKEKIAEQVKENNKPKEQEKDPSVAVSAQSAQGDDLKVTKDGIQSQQAGGTIKENGEDGVVARKDETRVTTNTDAAKILKEQIEKAKEKAAEDKLTGKEDEKEDAYKPQAQVNLTGKTEQQIEQLYRKGEISRYEYDKKLEENEEQSTANTDTADKQGDLIKEVAGEKEKMMQNKAMFDAVDNGNQDIMAAAMNLGKIE